MRQLVDQRLCLLHHCRKITLPRRLRFPLFVKSTTDDASLGIAQASVVEDAARLRERIEFVLEQHKSDVLVEEKLNFGSSRLLRWFGLK